MDEEQPEHESVARIQTRLKSGGKPPPKKKKRKRKEEGTRETRRAAKAAKSRGGRPKRCCRGCLCPGLRAAAAVGAGRAAVTLAAEGVTDAAGTGHGPVSGAGAGHPAAVVQRHPLTCQWQSQGTVGAKSRRRSFMEEQGLLWPRPRFPPLQRPLFRNGLNNSAEPKWRPPAHGSGSIGSHPRRPGGSRLGASVAVAVPANGTRAWGQQREKGWNKWPKKDEGRDWAKPDPKDKPPEGGEVFAAAPAAPGGDPYQVAEATKEEIEAAAARQAEREEEGLPRPSMAGGRAAGLG